MNLSAQIKLTYLDRSIFHGKDLNTELGLFA